LSPAERDLISIIIPYFNGEQYIEETLSAVLAQTYRNWEALVIDDGSRRSEASTYLRNLVEKISDPRIRHFEKKNEGLSATRNLGIANARGMYVALLDQDDLWSPEKLEKQVACFESASETGMVYTDAWVSNEVGGTKRRYSGVVRPHAGRVFEQLLFENFIVCSSVLIKKDVLGRVGPFNPQYKQAEEYDLFLRIAETFPIGYVDSPLTTYRVHQSNTTREQKYLAQTESREILSGFAGKGTARLEKVRVALARLNYADMKLYIKDQRWSEALVAFSKTAFPNPYAAFECFIGDLWAKLRKSRRH